MTNSFKFLFTFLLISAFAHSQTQRDTLFSEIIYNFPENTTEYHRLKADLKKLESIDNKPNPELLYNKLNYFYQNNDLKYFKETLTLLTRKYGFNLSYASGEENYYEAIIHGDLAKWFRKMYVKNHSKWLSKNLDKQIDIYKLNRLSYDDQLVHIAILKVRSIEGLTEEQLQKLRKMDGNYFKRNLNVLLNVSKKTNTLPTGNSFALIQNGYYLTEVHAMQHEDLFENAWQSLYPFYKTSYLNNDNSSILFRNIDAHMYQYNGKQVFDLLRIENIPDGAKNNPDDTEIPLVNPEQTKKLRAELGWE